MGLLLRALLPTFAAAVMKLNYQSDAHGSYVAAVCPNNSTDRCQLNAHIIAMVGPESVLDDIRVGGTFQMDGSAWLPLAVDSEYMIWNASNPRVSTGRASKQYKGYLQTALKDSVPKQFCAKIWAEDVANGDYATLNETCLAVGLEAPAVPQLDALEAHVNHYAVTYYCASDADCVLDAHMIISTYAQDPTADVFGGGAVSVDGGATFATEGVRVLTQAKPWRAARLSPTRVGEMCTLRSYSNVVPGLLGPRVQVSIEKRGARADVVPEELCFTLWAQDATTQERVVVLDNDAGEPLPDPKSPGLFCYAPYEIVDDEEGEGV